MPPIKTTLVLFQLCTWVSCSIGRAVVLPTVDVHSTTFGTSHAQLPGNDHSEDSLPTPSTVDNSKRPLTHGDFLNNRNASRGGKASTMRNPKNASGSTTPGTLATESGITSTTESKARPPGTVHTDLKGFTFAPSTESVPGIQTAEQHLTSESVLFLQGNQQSKRKSQHNTTNHPTEIPTAIKKLENGSIADSTLNIPPATVKNESLQFKTVSTPALAAEIIAQTSMMGPTLKPEGHVTGLQPNVTDKTTNVESTTKSHPTLHSDDASATEELKTSPYTPITTPSTVTHPFRTTPTEDNYGGVSLSSTQMATDKTLREFHFATDGMLAFPTISTSKPTNITPSTQAMLYVRALKPLSREKTPNPATAPVLLAPHLPSTSTTSHSSTPGPPFLRAVTLKYKSPNPLVGMAVPTTPLARRSDEFAIWTKPAHVAITTKKPRSRKPQIHRTNIHPEVPEATTGGGKFRGPSSPDLWRTVAHTEKFAAGFTDCPGSKASSSWQSEVTTAKSSGANAKKEKVTTTPVTNVLYPPQNDVPWDPQFHVIPTPEREEKDTEKGDKVKDPLVEVPETFAEPGPVWEKAKKEWGSAWEVHIYLTGSLFALLAVYSAVSILRLTTYVRLLSRGYFISLNFLMMVMGVTRAVYLLHCSYNFRRTYPPVLAYLTFNVTYPCLTSAFSVLFLSLLQATKVKLLSSRIQRPGVLMAVIFFHFAFSTTTDVLMGSLLGVSLLLFVCQAMFLLWSVLLSLGYFYIFRKLYRSALRKQGEMIRVTFTRLHIDGADLPKRLPRPTLGLAVKVTLAYAVLGLVMAGLQLYGMFRVYGYFTMDRPEPWPWWAFHFSCRLVEVAMGGTMAFIATQPMRHFDDRSTGACSSLWFPCTVFSGCSCRADPTVYSASCLAHHSFRNPGFTSTLDSPRGWNSNGPPQQALGRQVSRLLADEASKGRKLPDETPFTPLTAVRLTSSPRPLAAQDNADISMSSDEDGSNREKPPSLARSPKTLPNDDIGDHHRRSEEVSDDGELSVSECDSTRATAGSKVQSLCEDDFLQSSLSPFFQNGYQPRHKGISRCSLEAASHAADVPSFTPRVFLSNSAHDFTLFKYGSTCSSESAANSFDVYIQKTIAYHPSNEEVNSANTKILFPSAQLDSGESSSGSHDRSLPYFVDMATPDEGPHTTCFGSVSGIAPQDDSFNSFASSQQCKTPLSSGSLPASSNDGHLSDLFPPPPPPPHEAIRHPDPLSRQKKSPDTRIFTTPPTPPTERRYRKFYGTDSSAAALSSAPCSPWQVTRLGKSSRGGSFDAVKKNQGAQSFGNLSHTVTSHPGVRSEPSFRTHQMATVTGPSSGASSFHRRSLDVHLGVSACIDAATSCVDPQQPQSQEVPDLTAKSHSMNDLTTPTTFHHAISRSKKSRAILNRLRGSTLSLNSILHGYKPVDTHETVKHTDSVSSLHERQSSEQAPILWRSCSDKRLRTLPALWRFNSSQLSSRSYFPSRTLFRTSSS